MINQIRFLDMDDFSYKLYLNLRDLSPYEICKSNYIAVVFDNSYKANEAYLRSNFSKELWSIRLPSVELFEGSRYWKEYLICHELWHWAHLRSQDYTSLNLTKEDYWRNELWASHWSLAILFAWLEIGVIDESNWNYFFNYGVGEVNDSVAFNLSLINLLESISCQNWDFFVLLENIKISSCLD